MYYRFRNRQISGESEVQENISTKYKITAEIIKPSLLKENSWKLEPEKTAGIIISAEGETLQNALDLLQTEVSRPLNLHHLQVLVVGQEVVDNLQDICSFFERHPKIARRLRMIFVQGDKASTIFDTTPELERSITRKLVGMTEISKDFSLSTFKPFTILLSELRANSGQALGGALHLNNNNSFHLSGSVVLDNWKLAGWLNGEETRRANLLIPKSQKMTFVAKMDNGTYTYVSNKNRVKITPLIQKDSLNFIVKVTTDGYIIQEEGNELDLSEPKNIAKLEKGFSQIINNEVKEAIRKSQKELQVDYLGFGMILMDREPDYLKSIDWKKVFPTVSIQTNVQAKISGFGIQK
ncbi:MAG: Ger(x)C family spore germination protein [Clostridia bacterium]|nr:Ger(x)C family spore germination protein [Clostridia bacterium]